MRSLRIDAPGSVSIPFGDLPPLPEDGSQAIVEITYAGLGSVDARVYRGEMRGVTYPRVPGCRAGGIARTGPRASARVVLDPYIPCGECPHCLERIPERCSHPRTLGLTVDGAMTTDIAVPHRQLVEAPDSLEDGFLPLVEPLAVALQIVSRCGLTQDAPVVIFGAGMIGLMVAMLGLYYQAHPIIVEPLMTRLGTAAAMGVPSAQLIHAASDPVVDRVRDLTQGLMAGSVVDTSGEPTAIRQALMVAAQGAKVVLAGYGQRDAAVDTRIVSERQIEIFGVLTGSKHFPTAMNLLASGALDFKALMGDVVGLDEAPERIKRLADRPEEILHAVIRMRGGAEGSDARAHEAQARGEDARDGAGDDGVRDDGARDDGARDGAGASGGVDEGVDRDARDRYGREEDGGGNPVAVGFAGRENDDGGARRFEGEGHFDADRGEWDVGNNGGGEGFMDARNPESGDDGDDGDDGV